MNMATMKYNTSIGVNGKFQGSITTVQEDITTLITLKQKKKCKYISDIDSDKEYKFTKHESTPFLTC